MMQIDFPLQPGDALANVDDVFSSLSQLQMHFNIVDLLDLCSALESIVLYERILTPGWNYSGDINLLRPFLREGIISRIEIEAPANSIMEHPRVKELLAFAPRIVEENAFTEAINVMAWASNMCLDLFVESNFKIPLVLSAHFAPIYLALPGVQNEHSTVATASISLADQYKELSTRRKKLRVSLDSTDVALVPPIASEIICQSETIEGLINVTMDTRVKYEKLRRRFSDLSSILSSSDVSLKKKLIEQSKLRTSINRLYDGLEAQPLSFTYGVDRTLMRDVIEGVVDRKPGKLVAVALDKLAAEYWQLRMGALFRTKSIYLHLTKRDLVESVRRIFGHELGPADLEEMKRYEAYVQRRRNDLERSQT